MLFIFSKNGLKIFHYAPMSPLHNFIHQSLNSGSAQVQILYAACRRFEIVLISESGPGWK